MLYAHWHAILYSEPVNLSVGPRIVRKREILVGRAFCFYLRSQKNFRAGHLMMRVLAAGEAKCFCLEPRIFQLFIWTPFPGFSCEK